LKPNNDILGFFESILHDISSMGHLLVLSSLFVPVFLGLLLGLFFYIVFFFVSSTSGKLCTLFLGFSSTSGFFNISQLMLPTPISYNIEFILLDVAFETIIMLSSKSNFHPGQQGGMQLGLRNGLLLSSQPCKLKAFPQKDFPFLCYTS